MSAAPPVFSAVANPILAAALSYAARGIPVFPCSPQNKRPLTKKDVDPVTGQEIENSGGLRKATTDYEQIKEWWGTWPSAMIGVPTGPLSGIWGIDPDAPGQPGEPDGRQSLAVLELENGKLPATHTHLTPGGGEHRLFAWRDDKPVTNREGAIAKRGINVRGDGGYLIFPPSIAANGRAYEIAEPLDSFNFAEAPQWLYDLILAPREASISERAVASVKRPEGDLLSYRSNRSAYAQSALRAELDSVATAGPGERNNVLNTSAFSLGTLVGAGELSHGEVLGGLLDSAMASGLVREDGQGAVMATINSGLRAGMQNPRAIPERAPAGHLNGSGKIIQAFRGGEHRQNGNAAEPPPRVPLKATPYVSIDPKKIPRRDWIYGKHLVRKFVSGTVSPGGVGKSSLKIVEALALVSGKPLLGITPPRRMRVWLWNLEDPIEEIQRRIEAAKLHYGLTDEDIGDRLFVDSGRSQRLVIAKTLRDGAVIMEPIVDDFVSEMIENQIDVSIIDPFVSCHEIGENDNTGIDMVAKEWGRVADRANCAIELVHHTRKQYGGDTEITADSSRGAKALTDACRSVVAINRMTKEEGERAGIENHRLYFRTFNDKANLAPPADDSDWFKLESVDLGNGPENGLGEGDSVGVVTSWSWPDVLAEVTGFAVEQIFQRIKADTWRENHQAKNWVGFAVAQALGWDMNNRTHKAKIKALIKTWLAAGSLVIVTGKDEKGNQRPFVEVSETAQ